jgi:KDEL-tailed cysteine endopeptidase
MKDGLTYSLGVGKFADLTSSEFRIKYLSRSRARNHQKRQNGQIKRSGIAKRLSQTNKIISQELEIDWRKKNAVTGVKDQQTCGSDYAFSAVGAAEAGWSIHTN